jgi:hypothetical protein
MRLEEGRGCALLYELIRSLRRPMSSMEVFHMC